MPQQVAATDIDRTLPHRLAGDGGIATEIALAPHAVLAALGAEALADLAAWISTDEAARRARENRRARERALPA